MCGRLPVTGCGFLIFCAEPDRQPAAGKALSELMLLPLGVEYGGSRIIYYRAKEYVRDEDRYDLHVAFNHPLTLSSHVLNSIPSSAFCPHQPLTPGLCCLADSGTAEYWRICE